MCLAGQYVCRTTVCSKPHALLARHVQYLACVQDDVGRVHSQCEMRGGRCPNKSKNTWESGSDNDIDDSLPSTWFIMIALFIISQDGEVFDVQVKF